MAKRELQDNYRVSDNELRFLQDCAYAMDMEKSAMIRKAIALGLTQLVCNPFCRRVELQDTMDGLWNSVRFMCDKRNSKV